MKARGFVFASFAFLFSFFAGTAIAQQCSHHVGNWADNYNYSWNINSSGNGTLYTEDPCITYSPFWPVTGSTANGFVSLTAYNPGNDECAAEFWYDGQIARGGCRYAAGDWSNSSGLYGSFTMLKTCEVPPNGEITSSAETWIGPFHRYDVTVSEPGNGNLSGRFYREVDYSPAVDECWVSGDPPSYHVTQTSQSVWVLNAQNYYEDTNGRSDEVINYFRAQGRTPCKVTLHQRMEISCGTELFGGTPWTWVHSNVLVYEIRDTTIYSSRGSQVRQTPYP